MNLETLYFLHISTHSLTRRLTICQIPSNCFVDISTHSLTRRLTTQTIYNWDVDSISTHSLTRRLTIRNSNTTGRPDYFNSQPHKEADSNFIQ